MVIICRVSAVVETDPWNRGRPQAKLGAQVDQGRSTHAVFIEKSRKSGSSIPLRVVVHVGSKSRQVRPIGAHTGKNPGAQVDLSFGPLRTHRIYVVYKSWELIVL